MRPPDYEHTDNQMIKIEVNLDDMSGEWLGYVMDKLFDAGANDVYYSPIYMKKNRPAVQLQLLCAMDLLAAMKKILLEETTTLGIRYYPISVFRMERTTKEIITQWGMVRVKQAVDNGNVLKAAPEYEDCRMIAEKHHIPLREVYQAVWKQLD